MACFSVLACGKKSSAHAPTGDTPTLLTSKPPTLVDAGVPKGTVRNVQWAASPEMVELALTDSSDDLDDDMTDTVLSKRRSGRKATPAPPSFKLRVEEQEDDDKRVQWATEVESVQSSCANPESMSETASVASFRRSGRKATPAPSSFGLPVEDEECDGDRVRFAVEVESDQSFPGDSDALPKTTSVASFRKSGRKATPAPTSFKVVESGDEDYEHHVQWAMEVESVHSIQRHLDATPTASVASTRRSGRKATPAPSTFNLSADEMGSDSDSEQMKPKEVPCMSEESDKNAAQADGRRAYKSPPFSLYDMLPAWLKCQAEAETVGDEILTGSLALE